MDPNEHYIFYLGYPEEKYQEWKARTDKDFRAENIDYWHKYVNKKVSAKEVEEAIYSGQQPSSKYRFFDFLINNNDTLALKYWNIVNGPENDWYSSAWYYPTREEMANAPSSFASNKLNINTIAQCQDKGLRSRFALQLMRRAFRTGNHKLCIEVWDKYGASIPESALRTQCKSYYAGSLLYMDRKAESAVAFAEIEYYEKWLDYDMEVLRQIYKDQPNCPSFEFIVQQVVNAHFDKYMSFRGGMADMVQQMKNTNDFNNFADEVLADGKTKNPALWKSAQAAFSYIDGNKKQALNLINDASKMKGTDAVKDNVRLMRTVFLAADNTTGDAYEKALLPDLKWLAEKVNTERFYCDESYMCYENIEGLQQYYMKVLRRAVLVEIVSHFEKLGQPERCLAYLNMYSEVVGNSHNTELKPLPKDIDPNAWGAFKDPSSGNYFYQSESRSDYGTRFFVYADTASPETVKKYIAFMQKKGKSDMDKFLLSYSYRDIDYCNELLGTKYLRAAQWDSAIAYLDKVPEKFIMSQRIHYYLTQHNPFREEWITNSQQGRFDLPFSPAEEYDTNPSKLNYCKIMKRLQEYSKASDATTRGNAQYAYALAMYQMTQFQGWPLTRYSYGVINDLSDLYYNAGIKQTHTTARQMAENIISTSTDRSVIDKAFLLEYVLLWPEADYIFNIYNFDWEQWKIVEKKRDIYYTLCVNALLNVWGKRTNSRLTEDYIYRTFCDTEQDYR